VLLSRAVAPVGEKAVVVGKVGNLVIAVPAETPEVVAVANAPVPDPGQKKRIKKGLTNE
jgi:hypothetical protein